MEDRNNINYILNSPDFLIPKRLEGESDINYTLRKKLQKLYIKIKKKGQFIWISKDIHYPIKKDNKIIGYTESKGFTYKKPIKEKKLIIN